MHVCVFLDIPHSSTRLSPFLAVRKMLATAFGFQNPLMEDRYRRHFIASSADRAGPISRFWVPAVITLRLLSFVYWLLYPFEITQVETIIAVLRLLIAVFVFFILGQKRNDSTNRPFGLCFLWMARMVAILVALQQAAAKTTTDPNVMAGLVSYICFGAMVSPSFVEYLCVAIVLPFVRPIHMFLSRGMSEHVQQTLFQHALILALGLSISWTIHSDCRRDWLRFPAAPNHKTAKRAASSSRRSSSAHDLPPGEDGSRSRAAAPAAPPPAASPAAPPAAAAQEGSWDQLDDGYFTAADRAELRADAVRVRRPPP